MTTIKCDYCGSDFDRSQSEINRSHRQRREQYCSKTCMGKAVGKKNTKSRIPNVICALCQTPFYKKESNKVNSKSGLFFCCRAHKDTAQRIGGVKAIMPHHYGTSNAAHSSTYRPIALAHHQQKCVGCGYDTIPDILHVHHKDCDRNNNNPTNLEWRCGRCHDELHYLSCTGRWAGRNSKI